MKLMSRHAIWMTLFSLLVLHSGLRVIGDEQPSQSQRDQEDFVKRVHESYRQSQSGRRNPRKNFFFQNPFHEQERQIVSELKAVGAKMKVDKNGFIVKVVLRGNASNDILKGLRSLTHLYELSISGENVTDAELVHLQHLKSLCELYLRGTHITSNGLRHIRQLFALRTLYLRNTSVKDAGLVYIEDLKHLRVLNLRPPHQNSWVNSGSGRSPS